MVNKKGWLRIIEATVAILIVLGAILIIVGNRTFHSSTDLTSEAREILIEIASNVSLRKEVLSYEISPSSEEQTLKNEEIQKTVIRYINQSLGRLDFKYVLKICATDEVCYLENYPSGTEEIFAAERIISTNLTVENYNPKKIKLFIWKN